MITTTALGAAALIIAQAAVSEPEAVAAIEAQRERFNEALVEGDLETIAEVLSEDVVLVAGTRSDLWAGRTMQLSRWSEQFEQGAFTGWQRTPTAITPSPVLAMAMEYGTWRGANPANASDWVAGTYTAKWRMIDGQWRLEVETYMTTGCGGQYCPEAG
ncbi:MAG: nuclear transport factor 2 family protein [Pseudomonadota bacterium]